MGVKTYKFGIKEHKELDYQAIVLADDTHVVLGGDGVTIMFPKDKFVPIFKDQMKDKNKKYVGISFSKIELSAIMKGLDIIVKVKK